MKKSLGLILLVASLTVAGCITTAPPEGMPTPPPAAVKTYPPVTPEQATERNGHQVAQALMEEMDREVQQNLLATSPR